MRIQSENGTIRHLTYCTNVHPAETPDEVAAVVRDIAAPILHSVGGKGPVSLGLRLGEIAMNMIAADVSSGRLLDDVCAASDSYPVTLNVFPQKTFQRDGLKGDVYLPSWSTHARLSYTMSAARWLAERLPENDPYGTLSTVPLGWRGSTSLDACATHLVKAIAELARLEEETGRQIALALEPEPGCAFDRASDAIRWWHEHLRPEARRFHLADAVVARHLGLCYDTCHAAVVFDDPAEDAKALDSAGIAVHKLQVSSAPVIKFDEPSELDALLSLDEPRFLHQVSIRGNDGTMWRGDDLPALRLARDLDEIPIRGEARCHFHVPVHVEAAPSFRTTQSTLVAALRAFPHVRHVEVETYTFDVLPQSLRQGGLAAMIREELLYVRALISG